MFKNVIDLINIYTIIVVKYLKCLSKNTTEKQGLL